MTKIREVWTTQQGRGAAVLMERIREVDVAPEGADIVPDDTPVCEARPVQEES